MKRAISIFAVCFLTACSSCSSSTSNDGGTSGECTNLAICTVIPSATVNASTGFATTAATPTTSGPPVPSDECTYPTSDPGATVRITRICNDNAATSYSADSQQALAAGGMRSAVSGIGDAASYQTEPAGTSSKATLFAYKGTAYVIIKITGVKPAQDAMVKQGMISMGMTLFK